MRALSVWQPWASLLAAGLKGYETRSWQPPASVIGSRIAICSGRSRRGLSVLTPEGFDGDDLVDICDAMHVPMAFGCVLAVATVSFVIATDGVVGREVRAFERQVGDWSPGRFAWRLREVERLPRPVPVVGMQGLFELPADILRQVEEQLA